MAVSKRGGGYQAAFMLAGKRVREQFRTYQEAEAFELECRAAHALGKPLPDAKPIRAKGADMQAVLDAACNSRWKGKKSEATLSLNARLFVQFVGPKCDPAKAFEQIGAYVDSLGVSGSTVNRRLAAISVLAKTAFKMQLIPAIPEIPWNRKAGRQRLRFYTEAEQAQLCAEARRLGYDAYALLFDFLADTGARLGEAEDLAWSDCQRGQIIFRDTKNGETRAVQPTRRVATMLGALSQWDHARLGGPFKFINRYELRTLWGKLREALPWMDKDCVVHTFRHTCASRLVQAGHNLYHVQKWMGHKTEAMTKRYAHLRPQEFGAMAASLDVVAKVVANSGKTGGLVAKYRRVRKLHQTPDFTVKADVVEQVYTQDLKDKKG